LLPNRDVEKLEFGTRPWVQKYDRLWEKYGKNEKVFIPKKERKSTKLKLGEVDFTGEYLTGGEVLEFVPAFWDKYRGGEKLKESVGVMVESRLWKEEEDSNEVSLEPIGKTEKEKASLYKSMGPVGYKYKTDILRFEFPREDVEKRFSIDLTLPGNPLLQRLVGFLYSFQATHALAVVTELEVELNDIGCTWDIANERLFSYVYDAFEGGSGVTKKVFEDWSGKQQFIKKKIERILYPLESEKCCEHRCEKCILLPRTPEFLLRSRLLDKDYVRTLWRV